MYVYVHIVRMQVHVYVKSRGQTELSPLGMSFTSFETGSIINSVLINLANLTGQLFPGILWSVVSAIPKCHYAQYLHVSSDDHSKVLMLAR